MRKLAGRLSYSNVMATIAVFLALGAGAYAAVNLPRNSVKSKHIKNGQVKNKDLRDGAVNFAKLRSDIRPLHFDGTLNIGSLTDVILDEEGYRVAFSCQDDGGSPQVNGTLRVPEDGTLDLQTITSETPSDPDLARAVEEDVDAATPFPIQVSNPTGGEIRTTGATITYTGASRAAVLSVHGEADDVANTCTLNGSLIPLTQVE